MMKLKLAEWRSWRWGRALLTAALAIFAFDYWSLSARMDDVEQEASRAWSSAEEANTEVRRLKNALADADEKIDLLELVTSGLRYR